MTEPFQLPSAAEEAHRAISQKATAVLGGLIDGNGFKAAQVKLVRESTQIHPIPAAITVTLKPEISVSRLQGRKPQGTELGSEAEVTAQAAAAAQELLENNVIQQEVMQALKKVPGEGFGAETLALAVTAATRQFSVISTCARCGGHGGIACVPCHATGKMPCQTCRGQGYTSCRTCFGVGMVQDANGHRVSCTRCQHTGKIVCVHCSGHQQLTCPVCNGRSSTPCPECKQTGALTQVYAVSYKALGQFDFDWRNIELEVKQTASKLGTPQLAVKGHAQVFWQPPEMEKDHLRISCIAFLPIAEVEFSVEGKAYPATVAGLQGRIVKIDPLLDAAVKPGISALMKLSKGPLAVQALIDTACKYKLIRQAIAGLARYSQKVVYQTLVRDYPVVLSDKYARVTIRYADLAVRAISAGPRYKGLAAGTLLAALAAAGYHMGHLRSLILAQLEPGDMGQFIILPDIIVWMLGYAIAVFTIKFMTAATLKKILPQTVQMDKGALPSAGMQGYAAILTSGLVWLVVAACASDKPAWIMHVLGR